MVEGHPIAVTAYDQLTYSVLPIYAVQFDEPWPDGECALYIQQLASDGEPLPAEAWLLDCESNKLREIAVLDLEVTAPEP